MLSKEQGLELRVRGSIRRVDLERAEQERLRAGFVAEANFAQRAGRAVKRTAKNVLSRSARRRFVRFDDAREAFLVRLRALAQMQTEERLPTAEIRRLEAKELAHRLLRGGDVVNDVLFDRGDLPKERDSLTRLTDLRKLGPSATKEVRAVGAMLGDTALRRDDEARRIDERRGTCESGVRCVDIAERVERDTSFRGEEERGSSRLRRLSSFDLAREHRERLRPISLLGTGR